MPKFRLKSNRIVGFVLSINDSGKAEVIDKGSFTSISPLFYLIMENVTSAIIAKLSVQSELIYNLLVVLHDDEIADVFVNDFKVEARVKANRDIEKGEIIFTKDISDISDIRFPDIDILPSDAIVYCFRMRWKFGLYFDFTRKIQIDRIQKEIAILHKEVIYEDFKDAITNEIGRFKSRDALIITEGKTDWKHLIKAKASLGIKYNIHFLEDLENRGSDNLLKMCEYFSKLQQKDRVIFVFDRDEPSIIKRLLNKSITNLSYQDWGNNVYSTLLPIPKHRQTEEYINIELYYSDKDLMQKDKNERRMFFSNEFDAKSGNHKMEACHCMDLSKIKSKRRLIIDSQVYDRNGNSIALTKSDFAELVFNDEENFNNFDFHSFQIFFDNIEQIIKAKLK